MDLRLKLAGMTGVFGAAFFLIFSVPVVFAQVPVGVPVAPAVSSQVFEKIGIVAATGGKVELKMPGQAGRIAESGQPVFVGDQVMTDARGHLQILLLDETVFSIGPNSAITIDRFVYDPGNHNGEIKASVAKGVFRYVSGKVAAKNPNKVTVKLPTSTLGFRGTIVGGSVGTDGQGLVGLLGPGDNNDAQERTGSFTIEGNGGKKEHVNRTGFGVQIGENGGISNAFQLSQAQINKLTQGLGGHRSNGRGRGLGGDKDMGDLSGETDALTGEDAELSEGFTDLSGFWVNGRQVADGGIKTAENGITTISEPPPVIPPDIPPVIPPVIPPDSSLDSHTDHNDHYHNYHADPAHNSH